MNSVHRECRAHGPLGPAHGLRRELRVAGGRKPSSQVLEDVERETADQSDDRDFPEEGQGGDEVHICKPERAVSARDVLEGVTHQVAVTLAG